MVNRIRPSLRNSLSSFPLSQSSHLFETPNTTAGRNPDGCFVAQGIFESRLKQNIDKSFRQFSILDRVVVFCPCPLFIYMAALSCQHTSSCMRLLSCNRQTRPIAWTGHSGCGRQVGTPRAAAGRSRRCKQTEEFLNEQPKAGRPS